MSSITVAVTDTPIEIRSDGASLELRQTAPVIVLGTPTTTVGENNTGANVGGAAGEVFRDKSGAVLNLRTIAGINGTAVSINGDVIEIDGGGGGGTPGGIDAQIQFNDGGTFGADAFMRYLDASNQILFGDTAAGADFPRARTIISRGDTGETQGTNIGLVVESVAEPGFSGIAVRCIGQTAGSLPGYGVAGVGVVGNSADTGPAVGISGNATSPHTGGQNVAGLFYAANGDENIAIQIVSGDVRSDFFGIDWVMVDNNPAAIGFKAGGFTLLELDTTNGAEQIRIGDTAASADFPNARAIISQADTGQALAVGAFGVVGEAASDGTNLGIGVQGYGKTSATKNAFGLRGNAVVDNTADAGIATAGSFYSTSTHAGADNRALWLSAANGAENYAIYIAAGKIITADTGSVADFPGARAIISQADTGYSLGFQAGVVGEGEASASASGFGVVGLGRSVGAIPGGGGYFDAGVDAAGSSGRAVALTAVSGAPHSGGDNVALTLAAMGGANNYAIRMLSGDVVSFAAQVWTLLDNNAAALSFGSAGKLGLLVMDTTNGSERVLIDGVDLLDHSARHEDGGADEISVEALATGGAIGTVPTSDGAGGLSMALPGGSWSQDEFTPTAGQVSFIISGLPIDAVSVELFVNGVLYDEGAGADYQRSGATITWNNPFVLKTTDQMIVRFK